MNLVESALSNVTSPFTANVVRRVAGKAGLGLAVTWFLVYQLKYKQNSWTHSGGWVVSQVKPTTFIGQNGAQVVEKHASDFYDRGFKSSLQHSLDKMGHRLWKSMLRISMIE